MLFADAKQAVYDDITAYCASMRKTSMNYEPGLRVATEQFLQELEHSDYTTAELVLAGYELCGGTDRQMIIVAARALQMTHVYAVMSRQSTQLHVAAQNGMHAAHILLANLDAPESLRIKALSITNRALLLYMHGVAEHEVLEDLLSLPEPLLDYFATELTLNPLHVGMVLADADCAATDAITSLAMCAGKAQLTISNASVSDRYWQEAETALQKCTHWGVEALQPIHTLLARFRS